MIEALVDTSVFIATESGWLIDTLKIPAMLGVSVITIGELHAGVLGATDLGTRDDRLSTLTFARSVEPMPIDEAVAATWARLRIELLEAGRRLGTNDSWIAATAIAAGIPVITQDADYDDVPGLIVIRV